MAVWRKNAEPADVYTLDRATSVWFSGIESAAPNVKDALLVQDWVLRYMADYLGSDRAKGDEKKRGTYLQNLQSNYDKTFLNK